jgi:hypothetical protein
MTSISRRRLIAQGSAALAAPVLSPMPGTQAESMEVDLALVLAVDISRSVSKDEHRLQLEGYAAAFRSAEVIDAVSRGAVGAIAVSLLQWANKAMTIQTIGWTLIGDRASASDLAARIEAIPYTPQAGTSIGGALTAATALLQHTPYRPLRRVIDVSGDGTSIDPDLLNSARAAALAAGVTINGLPICDDGKRIVADYYAERVIGGPGAFLIVADGFHSFSSAIRRKLSLEIAGNAPRRSVNMV